MKSEWINKIRKGFLLRKNNGIFIDREGKAFNISEVNVLTNFFESEDKAIEYTITHKLIDYKVYEFGISFKHREVF